MSCHHRERRRVVDPSDAPRPGERLDDAHSAGFSGPGIAVCRLSGRREIPWGFPNFDFVNSIQTPDTGNNLRLGGNLCLETRVMKSLGPPLTSAFAALASLT